MSEPRRLEPSVWEIPVGYVSGMRVPGVVFANDELFAKAVEDRAVEQVANVATLPGIVGASYAMPDIHWGYGFPIGGVAATDVAAGGVVSPGGVLTYTIRVTNLGPSTVTAFRLTDLFPPGFTATGITTSAGAYDRATRMWTGLSLATGQSVVMRIRGQVSTTASGWLVR